MNVLVITPARVLFLIILVGTTLEVLTDQYRNSLRVTRWRRKLKDHVIICGYGTKGRAAVTALLETGYDKSQIVVVESRDEAIRQAAANGLVAIEGNATRSAVLLQADVKNCKSVIIATDSDEASVLITLTVRQLTAGQVRIIAAVREQENAALLKQSGAHHVIVSSSTAGRLLGLTTTAPPLIDVVEDLLTPGQGMALAMRSAERAEVGRNPRELQTLVVALIRRGKVVPLGGEATPDHRDRRHAGLHPRRGERSRRRTSRLAARRLEDGPGVAGVEQAGEHLVGGAGRPRPWRPAAASGSARRRTGA